MARFAGASNLHQAQHLGTVDRFVLEQLAGHQIQAVALGAQQLAASALGSTQDLLGLLVDDPGHLVGVLLGAHQVVAEEHGALGSPCHRPNPLGHAPFLHHRMGELGGLDQVVGGAGRHHLERDLLGGATAEHHHQAVLDEVLAVDVALLVGQRHRDAQRHAGRDDRHLVQRIHFGEHRSAHRVAGLVVGDRFLFGVAEHHRLAPLAHHHPVTGVLEVVGMDLGGAFAHGEEGGLVDQVGQIGAGHARSAAGDQVEVDVRRHLLGLDVHLEDAASILELGQRHDDLAVEAAGTQQGGIEDVGAVGRRHHDDALGGLEAVHLAEHLVERLLPLVVPAAHAGPTLAADRVDFVDEDDRPSGLAGRFEQIAHPAGADADEHLHEVRTGDRHERHPGLAGDRPGNQGFTGARRADQQHALGHAGTDRCEAVRLLEEVDDLPDLHLDAVVSGDIGEGRARTLGRVGLGLGATDRHDARHLARRTALHPGEETEDQGEGQDDREQRQQAALLGSLEGVLNVVVPQEDLEVLRVLGRAGRREGLVTVALEGALDLAGGVVPGDGLHFVLLDLGDQLVVPQLIGGCLGAREVQHRADDDREQDEHRPARKLAAEEATRGRATGALTLGALA